MFNDQTRLLYNFVDRFAVLGLDTLPDIQMLFGKCLDVFLYDQG